MTEEEIKQLLAPSQELCGFIEDLEIGSFNDITKLIDLGEAKRLSELMCSQDYGEGNL